MFPIKPLGDCIFVKEVKLQSVVALPHEQNKKMEYMIAEVIAVGTGVTTDRKDVKLTDEIKVGDTLMVFNMMPITPDAMKYLVKRCGVDEDYLKSIFITGYGGVIGIVDNSRSNGICSICGDPEKNHHFTSSQCPGADGKWADTNFKAEGTVVPS
jgi:co-chaperonin GroES (HSP10)